jgi:hypothetical protein
MPDFYPLMARAIARLEENTGDTRRALYERARATLVAHLRNVKPPLTKSEIVRFHFVLEEAILAAELDIARLQSNELQDTVEPTARLGSATKAPDEHAVRYDPVLQIMSAAHAAISRYHVSDAQISSAAS